jgi:hypothetical protein
MMSAHARQQIIANLRRVDTAHNYTKTSTKKRIRLKSVAWKRILSFKPNAHQIEGLQLPLQPLTESSNNHKLSRHTNLS